jgi:acetolactate synthase-1/2/3 large subunit
VSINGYDFYLIAGDYFRNQEQIFLDTGCTVAWAMQCLRIKNHFRVFHDNNNTAMGWSLPAAIGGALANPGFGTTCIVGDGSLMMNVQELATAFRYAPSLRVICLNNSGYGMVRQTERQWLESKYVGTDSRVGDLVFPEFTVLANSFGMKAKQVRKKSELRIALQEMYEKETTQFLEVIIEPDSEVNPQARFGYPIEDSEPALSQADLESHMIIPILQRPDSKH